MAIIEKQTTIGAPAETVFKYVSDIARHPEWAAHRLEIEPNSQGQIAVGSTFSCVGHEMGTHKGKVTVTELVPNSKLVYEAEDDTGRFRHHFSLQEDGGATRLTKGIEPLRLSLLFKILSPVALTIMVPRGLNGDLQRIKAKLEG